jgi:hypothetical protein
MNLRVTHVTLSPVITVRARVTPIRGRTVTCVTDFGGLLVTHCIHCIQTRRPWRKPVYRFSQPLEAGDDRARYHIPQSNFYRACREPSSRSTPQPPER